MPTEFTGIERRLDELSERLARLQPLKDRKRTEFDQDPYLRDIVERNLEIAAQFIRANAVGLRNGLGLVQGGAIR